MSFLVFWEKYKPVIVMVPTIVAIHYGWFWLQGNEAINPNANKGKITEQPIITVRNHIRAQNIPAPTISTQLITFSCYCRCLAKSITI